MITPCEEHLVNSLPRGTLQWRHDGCDCVSNHQPYHCLLKRLFRRRSKKTSNLRVTGLCAGNSTVIFPHKWPVTRKMYPFDDVIIKFTGVTIKYENILLIMMSNQADDGPYHTHSMRHNDGRCFIPVPPLITWRHQSETFSASLALCEGNSPVTGEFPSQRPLTRSFDVFFDLRLNKRLSKQSSRGWWFETPSRSLWRHCNELG